jgi:hypothetical protein
MLKPLTLSLSLAVALGACSVSMAGLFASPQCSPQVPCASPQSCLPSAQCAPKFCLPKICLPKICLPKICLPKPTCSYEWVLKKKICWTWPTPVCSPCSPQCAPQCSPQLGSSQAYPTTYGSGQIYGGAYGAGQMTAPPPAPAGEMAPAPAGDEAPPAPEVAPAAPAAPSPSAPEPPAPPAPSAPTGPQSSLLFTTPSGN